MSDVLCPKLRALVARANASSYIENPTPARKERAPGPERDVLRKAVELAAVQLSAEEVDELRRIVQ